MRRIIIIFLLMLGYMAFGLDLGDPHAVVLSFVDTEGNFPLASDITFDATLNSITKTESNAILSRYIENGGYLYIQCSEFGEYNFSQDLELTVWFDESGANEEIFYFDSATHSGSLTDVDAINITQNNVDFVDWTQQVYNNSEADDPASFVLSDGSTPADPIVIGIIEDTNTDDLEDIAGRASGLTGGTTNNTISFDYIDEGRAVDGAVKVEVTVSGNPNYGSDPVTIKQYDSQRRSVPDYNETLALAFEINENIDIDYSSNNFTYTFAWTTAVTTNYTSDANNVYLLYSLDNGETWTRITSNSEFMHYSTIDYQNNESGLVDGTELGATIVIDDASARKRSSGGMRGHTADMMFAFGDGSGDNPLQMSTPTNLNCIYDYPEYGRSYIYLYWDAVAGANLGYELQKHNKSADTWSAVTLGPNDQYNEPLCYYKVEYGQIAQTDLYKIIAKSDYCDNTTSNEFLVSYQNYKTGIFTNNCMVSLGFSDIYTNASDLGADMDNCELVAQWDNNNQEWETCSYIDFLDTWIGDFTLNSNEPVMTNISLETNFAVSDHIANTSSVDIVEGTNYIIIPRSYNVGSNTISDLKTDLGSASAEITKYNNTLKMFESTDDTDTVYYGDIYKVVMPAGSYGDWPD